MRDNKPESQSLSPQIQETARWASELLVSWKEDSPKPGGQWGRQSPQSIRAEPQVADAKGDQRGVEQHYGTWSSAVSAVVWGLPQLYLESCVLHPSGSLDKYLGTPDGKQGTSPDGLCLVSPALQTQLFWSRVQISYVCLLARCV